MSCEAVSSSLGAVPVPRFYPVRGGHSNSTAGCLSKGGHSVTNNRNMVVSRCNLEYVWSKGNSRGRNDQPASPCGRRFPESARLWNGGGTRPRRFPSSPCFAHESDGFSPSVFDCRHLCFRARRETKTDRCVDFLMALDFQPTRSGDASRADWEIPFVTSALNTYASKRRRFKQAEGATGAG